MQESASANLAREDGRDGDVALTQQVIEQILGDFRDWLTRMPLPTAAATAAEEIDLATVVRQFTALRQEVNLQTRAGRAQLEQNSEALEKLTLIAKAQVPAAPAVPAAIDELAIKRPLLKSLIDVRDSLALAERQFLKSKDTSAAPPPAPQLNIKLPAWTRWFDLEEKFRTAIAPLQEWAQARAQSPAGAAPMESLATGYSMSLQRLDRTLEQHGLERVPCVGRPFDPEIMEAVEVVNDPSRTGSEVIEEVRPGYRLREQIFRCAQVRVARP